MTLPLELGGNIDPQIRRALEVLSQQFPVVATGGGGGAPTGPAGGVLGGTYPNPGFAVDMATQAELDTHTTATTTAHGGIVASSDARLTDARTPTAHTHPAADIASGVLATARLGSGTPAASTYVDGGTGAWTTLPAGGGGAVSSPWVAVVSQAADVTNATTTNVNTDLVFSFDANSTYIIDLYLMTTSAATTTGVAFAWDTSVAVTNANLTFEHQLAAAGTLTGGDAVADDTVRGLSSGVPDTATTPIIGMGIVRTTTNAGTCRLRFRPEVAASATFKAGSTMRVMKVGATTSGITTVTSLPASPANGQEVYYQFTPTIVGGAEVAHFWHLRYDAASTAWYPLGALPIYAEVATEEFVATGTTYTTITTAGPGITVPLAGDYDVEIGCNIVAPNTAAAISYMSYAIGATAASDNDAAWHRLVDAVSTRNAMNLMRGRRKTGLTASTALSARYRCSVAAITPGWGARWMKVQPIRITG